MISPEKMSQNLNNILIVFDAAGYNPLSIQTVIELAIRSQTGIQAVYIEDNNLINAVGLPFTREISLHTAAISHIDSSSMLQKLQADAENIKKQVEAIAFTRSVSFSFSSVRGQKTQVIKNRTQELSMVFIPAVYSNTGRKQQHQLKHEIAVIFDAQSPSCEKALSIALSQAAKNMSQLFVITDCEQSIQHVELLLRQQNGHGTCRIADLSKADDALLLLQKHSPGLLVLSEDSRLFDDERVLQRMIDSLESDILLIR
jgi:hypothetical protein